MRTQAELRRRRVSFLGILLLAGVVATALIAFTRPSDGGGPELSVSLASLRPGEPMPHVVDGLGGDGAAPYAVWLVRDDTDGVRALLGRDPFSGCRVEWDAGYDLTQVSRVDPVRDRGAFKAFCSGWVFLPDGRVVFGAAVRGLDEYEVTVDGDRVRVSFERVTLGQCAEGQGLARGLCSLPGAPVHADVPPPPQVPR